MNGYIKSNDIDIYYEKDLVENSRATIIINHGFAEHLSRYDYVAKKLNERGFSVYRYDVRGHGKTISEKGDINSYEDFISDLDSVVDFVKRDNKPENLFTLGHSMGGLITGLYGIEFPNKLNGQIFSGPAIGHLPDARGIRRPLLKVLAAVMPKYKLKNIVENKICSVEEVVEAYKQDPLVIKEASARFYREFGINGIDYFLANKKKYSYPVLICHGEEDLIVPKEVSFDFYNEMRSQDKEIKIYEGLYHEILNENEKDEIIDYMANWIDNRI